MKKLFLLSSFLSSLVLSAQTGYKATRNNGVNQTTEDYVINSPGNTPSNSVTTARYKDSTYVQWLFANAYFANLPNSVNNGNPVNFLHTDGMGRVLSSSISWLYPDTLNTFVTKWHVGSNYYDKAQSDMRYLQSFNVDSQMVVTAVGTNVWSYLLNKSYNVLTDTPNLSVYYLASNPNGYISSYTETDPLFNSKFTTAILPYLKGIDTASLSSRIDGKLNNRYVPVNIDSLNTNEIQSLIGNNRTISLSNGGGSYTMPQANWDSLLNKPTISSQVNISGAQNTKTTGIYPNITISDSFTNRYYNSSGLINQNIKVWCDTISPNVSNNFSINISSAGFTRILSANIIAIRNTTTAATVPNAAIKTISTNAITCNIVEDNPSTVSILGISVLSGLPSIFANVSGLQIAVTVIGY